MPDSSALTYIPLIALAALIVVLVILALRRRRPAPPPAPGPTQPEAYAYLRLAGSNGPPTHVLSKPLSFIGRGPDNDIRVSPDVPGAASVSRRHAQIRREDADFVVEDLGSKNGIRVNGLSTQRNLLRDGYRVAFGEVEFVFHTYNPNDTLRNRS
jgi:MYXO-CTERM domain-containing protein